jgi:DNA-binding NarL/FixJ family response regulator
MTSPARRRWPLHARSAATVSGLELPEWCLIVADEETGDDVAAHTLRVVIADDHPYYRKGLARLLEASGLEVLADVPNGEAAIQAVAATAPDVVVMDLNMPGLSGVEATRRLTEQSPATRVLVLSVSADETDVTEAVLAGASGYVLKDGPVEDVVAGIRAAAAGQSIISPRIAAVLLQRLRDRTDGTELSSQEVELLALLAEGRSGEEVAERLAMSTGAVRNHITNILAKLQAEHRVGPEMPGTRGKPL